MEGLSTDTNLLAGMSYEELEQLRLGALGRGDYETLQAIRTEAVRLDGYDDTDPRFGHLSSDCTENIKNIMVEFG